MLKASSFRSSISTSSGGISVGWGRREIRMEDRRRRGERRKGKRGGRGEEKEKREGKEGEKLTPSYSMQCPLYLATIPANSPSQHNGLIPLKYSNYPISGHHPITTHRPHRLIHTHKQTLSSSPSRNCLYTSPYQHTSGQCPRLAGVWSS